MRTPIALSIPLLAAALAAGQDAPKKEPPADAPRFGLAPRPRTYPQATPKQAVESAIAAAEAGEFDYLVAHLLDPAFVEARLADRAKQFEPAVTAELAQLRDQQKRNPERYRPEVRIPDDPDQFRARVAAEARTRAFRQLVADVRDKLTDDPEVVNDLRRFNRTGTFTETGDAVKVTLAGVQDRAVFLKKIGERWYVENRQTEEKAPDPKVDPKADPEKK